MFRLPTTKIILVAQTKRQRQFEKETMKDVLSERDFHATRRQGPIRQERFGDSDPTNLARIFESASRIPFFGLPLELSRCSLNLTTATPGRIGTDEPKLRSQTVRSVWHNDIDV